MRLIPKSLTGRLLTGGIVLIAVTMVAAGLLIGAILDRFIVGQIDQRLDSTVNDLASQLALDEGVLKLGPRGEGPDYLRPKSGWYWQISDASTVLRSPALDMPLVIEPPRFDWRELLSNRPSPTRAVDANGVALHGRVKTVTVGADAVTIVATAPQMAIVRPLIEALSALLICLVALSVLLLLGLWLQVRIGLTPLRKLQASVSDVASGRLERIPDTQPIELQPLSGEMNRLIKQSADRLELTRLQAANLAHSLKTPLATLSLSLAKDRSRADQVQLVTRMEQSISHHLGRTRMAVSKGYRANPLKVHIRISDILTALEKIYAEKALHVTLNCPQDLTVACDPSDFDEIAGNLLENAFKWAKSCIAVNVLNAANTFKLEITDDGPGLTNDQIADALQPGKRLDQSVAGDGFGLPIVAELVGLYGGTLQLGAHHTGDGLAVTVSIPDR